VSGPASVSGRTVFIPGLDCAVAYEFGVVAVAGDGTPSAVAGTTVAAPTAACPGPEPTTTIAPEPPETVPPDVVPPVFTG